MFTLHKLAVLIAIIGAAWYGLKLLERLQGMRRAAVRASDGENPAQLGRQDLSRCEACGVFVPARGAGSTCGRGDCPRG